jgi:hypothetical protein
MMFSTLNLNCLIYGQGQNHIFPVNIESTETVGALRETKEKIKPQFDHVPTCPRRPLELWSVSIPVDNHFERKVNDMEFDDVKLLLPVKRLSGVFSDQLEDEYLHVVIRPLPASECQ